MLGCEPIQTSNIKYTYACDEQDAVIHCTNGDTIIVDHVKSPAKTKNGMICIYDKWRNFDARIQIPVEQVKLC